MVNERGMDVHHTTVFRWVQEYAPEIDKRCRSHLHPTNDSWRVDEIYIEVKGKPKYLYRAVDSAGNTLDFLLTAKRDAAAAKRFFRKTLKAIHVQTPRVISVDKNAAYPKAIDELKVDKEWLCCKNLIWDNATWHLSKQVRQWIKQHNAQVKRTGKGVRLIVCHLPVNSPWLNAIEPKWIHAKRAIVEPQRKLTAKEIKTRVCDYFGCPLLEPLAKKVS